MHQTELNQIKLKTLVVDDEAEIRMLLVEILSELPLEIVEASSGVEAWELFQKNKFDLVLSDIHMPGGMTGIHLAEKIIQNDFSVPVLLITAYDDRERILSALRVGVFDFISKPVQTEFLVERVRRAIDKRKLSLAEIKVIDILHEMLDIPNDHTVERMSVSEKLEYIHELVTIASIKRERKNCGCS